jgi:hypothetical protein
MAHGRMNERCDHHTVMIIDGHDMPMGSGGDRQLLKGYRFDGSSK